jgi:outer membrane biosynthesis protein TonB
MDGPRDVPVPDRRVNRMTREQLREKTGVDVLPGVVSPAELHDSLRAHYPAELRGTETAAEVLVDVALGSDGEVQRVAAVEPEPDTDVHMVRVVEGHVIQAPPVPDEHRPLFAAAARDALREVQFTPARRDGENVPFTLRMHVHFRPAWGAAPPPEHDSGGDR